MTLKSKLDKLESVIKVADEKDNIENMSLEERRSRIATYTCGFTGMDIDTYWALSEKERAQLHSDMYVFMKAMNEGKTHKDALEVLKQKNPNYRKEIEKCH